MVADRDLYQVLGVSPTAGADEIRRAQRRLVRALHPDRHVEATAAERALAERRMREINEAWHTLRDPSRRSSYDATRRPPTTRGRSANPPSAPRSSTTRSAASGRPPAASTGSARPRSSSTPGRGAYWSSPADGGADDVVDVHPGTFFLLRRGPLLVALVVVLGLFVVTAYVGGNDDGGTVSTPPLEACVVLTENAEGFLVECSSPNDGEVVAQVRKALDCPDDTRYVQVGTDFFCIPTAGES